MSSESEPFIFYIEVFNRLPLRLDNRLLSLST